MQKNAGQLKKFVWIFIGNSGMQLKKRGKLSSRKLFSITILIILNGYMLERVTISKKEFLASEKKSFGISRVDIQWLLEHFQVSIVNKQNTTWTPLQPIVVTEIPGRIKSDLIAVRIKPNSKHVQIEQLKDDFFKFSMLYTLTSKKASKIGYYISFFIWYMRISGILRCDNRRQFKATLLLFLKKHNIKLINCRPKTLSTQRRVKKVNTVVKNKIIEWPALNSSSNWASTLTEIGNPINNQTSESLLTSIILMEVMFF